MLLGGRTLMAYASARTVTCQGGGLAAKKNGSELDLKTVAEMEITIPEIRVRLS